MQNNKKKASIKDYLLLHISILIFSFTSVFTKMASNAYNRGGLKDMWLYVFLFLMLFNCFLYAIVWQKTIQRFEFSIAYANKSVYLIWTQIWAVLIFKEVLTVKNLIGLIIVFAGVLVVQRYE